MATERKPRAANHLWKPAFLASYRDSGNVRLSAAKAGIDRKTYYAALKSDPAFAEALEEAKEDAVDILEARAREGATLGFEEVLTYQGEITGTVRKVHPSLLMFLLKSLRPEVYGDKKEVKQVGPGGGPIQHRHTYEVDLDLLSTEQLETLREIARIHEAARGETKAE